MNVRGELYRLEPATHEQRRRLEHATGPLEPVTDAELPAVRALDPAGRRAWFLARKAERKRERAARKAARRAKR